MSDAIEYAKAMIGAPYKYWHPNDIVREINDGPFWASSGPLPSPEQVRASSCNCAGLINLMRRKAGLSIPGMEGGWEVPGGTPAWEMYLDWKDWAEMFDPKKKYPDGTLLLRTYRSPHDQGHLAVIVGDQLLQSFGDRDYDPADHSTMGPGINMDISVEYSHSLDPEGYYQFACLPENWLEKD
jgi:hypothetical protein